MTVELDWCAWGGACARSKAASWPFPAEPALSPSRGLPPPQVQAFVMDVEFAPGRYVVGDKVFDPFGTAKMQFISIADAYFKSNQQAYDYGVRARFSASPACFRAAVAAC
jgi:hypothetical protein